MTDQMTVQMPRIDDVTFAEIWDDPFPLYARMRRDCPVAWVSAARIHLVTRFDDIHTVERDCETFPAYDPNSLQIRAMGRTMMRRDGEDHLSIRRIVEPAFHPKTVRDHWTPEFQRICDGLIDGIRADGSGDLFSAFAAPLASKCLAAITGLTDTGWEDLAWWSQALMDGVGNYSDDADIWARNETAFAAIDAAIDARIPVLRAMPDQSMLSLLVAAEAPLDMIRANLKVVIGGGLNEPRDAVCTALHGLLSNPDQFAQVRADLSLCARVFEEAVRWCAPIGMYPRRVAREVELGGATLHPGDIIGLSVASACHDESRFENGGRFDINRPKVSHLAFGAGPHFCLGTWAARKMVGEIALPALIDRLPGLRADPDTPARFGGWVFRGPLTLPVLWDA